MERDTMRLPKSLEDKKVHTVDETHRAILDEKDKMLAYGVVSKKDGKIE